MEQQRGERLRKLFTLVWCFMLKYCQQLVLELPQLVVESEIPTFAPIELLAD